MSDQKSVNEKMASLGESMSSNLSEALHDAQPAMNRMGQRMKDELHHLGESGREAVSGVKQKLDQEVQHVRVTAEHYIQQQPLSAVVMAAGAGAVVALAVSWFMRSRSH